MDNNNNFDRSIDWHIRCNYRHPLLFPQDLIRLFACYNDGIINLLGKLATEHNKRTFIDEVHIGCILSIIMLLLMLLLRIRACVIAVILLHSISCPASQTLC